MKKKIIIVSAVLCCFAMVALDTDKGNAADKEAPGATFKSYDMNNYPQGGFNMSAAHAGLKMTCGACHESNDPMGKPEKEKSPSAAKCSSCHKTPSGTVTTKDYKANGMRTFDPHNNHEKGGCLTCHSEHFASRLSCNVGGCHDFKDLKIRKK